MSAWPKTARVLDPRLARESGTVQLVNEGPSSQVFQTVTTPDPHSLSPSWVIQVPAVTMGVSRTVRIHMTGTITLTGTNLNAFVGGTYPQNLITLRQFPIQSIMSNLQAQINDLTVSLPSPYLYIHGLAAVANTSCSMGGVQSTFPSEPDTFSDNASAVGVIGGIYDQLGSGPYGDAVTSGRSAQITGYVLGGGNTTLAISFDISEPLVLSPFSYWEGEGKWIYGVQTLTITANYANVHRMLSLPLNLSALSAVTITKADLVPANQTLELTYIAPSDDSLLMIPREHLYSYTGIQQFVTTGTTVAAGATVNIASNAFELATVPQKFVVYATYQNADIQNVAISPADVCMSISQVQVQYGSRAGLYSGATSINLWECSRRAGSKDKYPIWAGKPVILSSTPTSPVSFVGRPFIIDVANDLSLPAGSNPLTPGMRVKTQFSISANFTNQTGATINNPQLIILVLTPGYVCIKDGSTGQQLGGVTLEEARHAPIVSILEAERLTGIQSSEGISGGAGRMKGAGFFDDVLDFAKDAATSVGKAALQVAAPLAAPLVGQVPFVGPILQKALGGAAIGGASIGGRKVTRRRSALLGGAMMPASMYDQ